MYNYLVLVSGAMQPSSSAKIIKRKVKSKICIFPVMRTTHRDNDSEMHEEKKNVHYET